jgi:hypothetical protein
VLLRWRSAGGGGFVLCATASSAFFHGAAMSSPLIALTGLIYLYVAIDQFRRGNLGMGIAYLGYSFSSIGLYSMAR